MKMNKSIEALEAAHRILGWSSLGLLLGAAQQWKPGKAVTKLGADYIYLFISPTGDIVGGCDDDNHLSGNIHQNCWKVQSGRRWVSWNTEHGFDCDSEASESSWGDNTLQSGGERHAERLNRLNAEVAELQAVIEKFKGALK
jgi:hypothetical protein